jgi:hypothetical protein
MLSILWLAVMVLYLVGMWKVFTKAGQPGWAAIIPIYNLIVLIEISGKPLWYIVLFLIPIANLVAAILVGIGVAQRFGKTEGFGVGLGLLGFVFYPILGLGDAQYQGPPVESPTAGAVAGSIQNKAADLTSQQQQQQPPVQADNQQNQAPPPPPPAT